MLVEIKDKNIAKELIEKGMAKEISPLIAYYKDELKCYLEYLISKGKLNSNNVDELVENLSYGWLDIYFDDVVDQIQNLVSRYLLEINNSSVNI